MECYSESRFDDKLLCSDGSVQDKWTGCVDNNSVRVQCPKGHVPCNKLNSNGEFVCSTDCSNHDGDRTCYLKHLVCVKQPYDYDELVCLNGDKHDIADGWSGCVNDGSVRIQCPKGHYPCNYLRSNGKEFQCQEDCTNYGGYRDCEIWYNPNYSAYSTATISATTLDRFLSKLTDI